MRCLMHSTTLASTVSRGCQPASQPASTIPQPLQLMSTRGQQDMADSVQLQSCWSARKPETIRPLCCLPCCAGLILLATTITVSVTIPLFSAMAGALFLVSGIMLTLYLPAATHFKKLRMGTSGESTGGASTRPAQADHDSKHALCTSCDPPPYPACLPAAITAGDVVTLVAEALDGLTVIQAYNKQQHFTTITSKVLAPAAASNDASSDQQCCLLLIV